MESQNSKQNSGAQLTYTVTQETRDQNRTYTLASETDETVARRPSLPSTVPTVLDPELISVCGCLINGDSDSFEDNDYLKEKRKRFENNFRIESYLRERRIPELIRFILAKIMVDRPRTVSMYIGDLLDQCMLFRAGYCKAPVLFEERHLEAVVKSFDPCNRGWMTTGQVRRAFTTLGLTPKSNLEVKTSTQEVLEILRETQERELLLLLSAGTDMEDKIFDD
ncbi:hypothetical protein PYW08_013512 [Mythimna loreyi]|uniref:Uncharacterized protein n=1 Tax=Mythimna loreyi TaxID=667449 RepID=A0ACC2QG85_9NEOP|nr:hypothetical protein PYW08_013512 [Mythimna loreyi]